jgi:hypothetical protein
MTVVRELAGQPWYVEAAHYPTAIMAKRAWERAERKLILGPGEDGIGVTRLAPNPDPAAISTGAPPGAHIVAVVTLNQGIVPRAIRALRDGTSWDPPPEFCDTLIHRRARMMLAQVDSDRGRVVIRRPEGRGAHLRIDGELIEPPPGRG